MNEKQASVSKTQPSEDNEEDMEDNEENNGSRHGSCGCLWLLCLRNNESQQRYDLLHQPEEIKESWVMKKGKKLREISEVLAGPKWKNFIRRFRSSMHKKRTRMQFNYDPQSYALNFDDKEVDGAHADHHFAARFAAPLQTTL